ncbi:hypothetical protein EGH24_01030 [Halonotius terrestris]|uniref:Uncharacterized protein n=1 Tax=Halonotius terrestris TaxID=2487750 RepID=A0A8J8TCD3_9EURY|nr:hypothetical protein [Halonotius terrestris]TQQ83408.1 hypothetical protein EGH24_01030 [Halonotius terrestris]
MVSQGTGLLAALCCSLLLMTVPAAAVANAPAAAAGSSSPTAGSSPAAISAPSAIGAASGGHAPLYQTDGSVACFPDSGYDFTIGTLGPRIDMVVHLSLLTNLGAPGTFGVELAGSADEAEPLIELRTGAVFHGVDDTGAFLENPFSVFSIAFEYRFQLPIVGIDYETTEAPISGPVGESRCA